MITAKEALELATTKEDRNNRLLDYLDSMIREWANRGLQSIIIVDIPSSIYAGPINKASMWDVCETLTEAGYRVKFSGSCMHIDWSGRHD